MTDFAKTQLMKYGWTEGKGLGKTESGITEALKPKLKFDTTGFGHKDNWNEWWETGFNKAANNIVVESQTHGVSISVLKKGTTCECSKEELDKKKSKYAVDYGNFHKTSTLLDGNLTGEKNSNILELETIEKDVTHTPLTDEELFKVCGGRTAHKGARHGLKLHGKLKRIAKQEEELLHMSIYKNMSDKLQKCNSDSKGDKFEIDNNENTMSPITFPLAEEQSVLKISKSRKRKNKRCINNLTHQLNILCNVSDDNERNKHSTSNDASAKKKLRLKRKRKRKEKESSMSHDDEGIGKEEGDKGIGDIPLPVSQKLDKETTGKQIQEQIFDHSGKESDNESTRKKKKKKSKKKKNQDYEDGNDRELDGSQAKKFKKSHKSDSIVHNLTKEYTSQTELVCNRTPLTSHQITDSFMCSESPDTHFKKEVDRLNARISKRKMAKLHKKQKIKLDKITQSLEAVHFNTEEPTKKKKHQKEIGYNY